MLGIIKPRYARNYIPKFQAEFHIAEEEPDAPWVGPLERLGNHVLRSRTVTFTLRLPIPLPSPVPHPRCLPDEGFSETSLSGASGNRSNPL